MKKAISITRRPVDAVQNRMRCEALGCRNLAVELVLIKFSDRCNFGVFCCADHPLPPFLMERDV